MSNRPCNLCNLELLMNDAKKNNKIVIIQPSKGKLRGDDIYVTEQGEAPSKANWVCWMMKIPEKCEC